MIPQPFHGHHDFQGICGPLRGVLIVVPEILLDLLLPETDRGVFIQWAIMAPFWLFVIVATRRQERDIRTFVYGLAMMNLAWFAARTVH